MTPNTLPKVGQRILDERGYASHPWYAWFGRIQKALDAGAISDDEAAAAISAIATILGSPDGTVENIPPLNFLRATTYVNAGAGIAVSGSLASGGVTISATPTDGATAALANGAFIDPTTDDYDLIVRKITTVSALAVGLIGDSIGAGSTITTPPSAIFATLASTAGVTVTMSNEAVPGAVVANFVPGTGAYYAAAKAQFVTDGVKIVNIMIGTNDCRTGINTTKANYRARLLLICNDLIASGFLVALSYPPYMGQTTGFFDATSPGLVLDYIEAIDSLIDNQHIFRGDTIFYEYSRVNAATALQVDGVHASQAGSDYMAGLWADALRPIIAGLTNQAVLQRAEIGPRLAWSMVGSTPTLDAVDGDGGVLPMVNGDVPPTLLYAEDGSLIYFEV